MIVVPTPIVRQSLDGQLPLSLVPSDVGFFPQATNHYIERAKGSNELILILCVGGVGWLDLNDRHYSVVSGQLAIIPPRRSHRYGTGENDPWSIYWCHAAGAVAERFAKLLTGDASSAVVSIVDYPRLIGAFEMLTDLISHGYGLNNLIYASTGLAHLLGIAFSLTQTEISDRSGAVDRVRQTATYLRDRPHAHINVPDLARMCNLSLSHFCALFKATMGFPPLDYFLRIKTQRACALLATTDLPLKRVAAQIGFEDPLYFSRVFRRIQGLSPREYRSTVKTMQSSR